MKVLFLIFIFSTTSAYAGLFDSVKGYLSGKRDAEPGLHAYESMPKVCNAFLTENSVQGKDLLGQVSDSYQISTDNECVNYWLSPGNVQIFIQENADIQNSLFNNQKKTLRKLLRQRYIDNLIGGLKEYEGVFPLDSQSLSEDAKACLASSGRAGVFKTSNSDDGDSTQAYLEHSAAVVTIAQAIQGNINEARKKIDDKIKKYQNDQCVSEGQYSANVGFGGAGIINNCSQDVSAIEMLRRTDKNFKKITESLVSYQKIQGELASSNPTLFQPKLSFDKVNYKLFELELNDFGKELEAKLNLDPSYKKELSFSLQGEDGTFDIQGLENHLSQHHDYSSSKVTKLLNDRTIHDNAKENIKKFYDEGVKAIETLCTSGEDLLQDYDKLVYQVIGQSESKDEAALNLGAYCYLKQDQRAVERRRDLQLYGSMATLIGGGVLSFTGVGGVAGVGVVAASSASLTAHQYSEYRRARVRSDVELGGVIGGFGDYEAYLKSREKQFTSGASLGVDAAFIAGSALSISSKAFRAVAAFSKERKAVTTSPKVATKATGEPRRDLKPKSQTVRSERPKYIKPSVSSEIIMTEKFQNMKVARSIDDLKVIAEDVVGTLQRKLNLSKDNAEKGLLNINRVMGNRDIISGYAKELEGEVLALLKSKGIKPKNGGWTDEQWSGALDEVLKSKEKAHGFSSATIVSEPLDSATFRGLLREKVPITDKAFSETTDHGIFTHRFQWYVLMKEVEKNPELIKPFAEAGVRDMSDLYVVMETRTREGFSTETLWDKLFDGGQFNSSGYINGHSPEILGEFMHKNFTWFQ